MPELLFGKGQPLTLYPNKFLARIVTYNNGTIALDADKPYRALISRNVLTYDTYDEDDGTSIGPEIEFDLTVGPYATATAIIDSKISKGKKSIYLPLIPVRLSHFNQTLTFDIQKNENRRKRQENQKSMRISK